MRCAVQYGMHGEHSEARLRFEPWSPPNYPSFLDTMYAYWPDSVSPYSGRQFVVEVANRENCKNALAARAAQVWIPYDPTTERNSHFDAKSNDV